MDVTNPVPPAFDEGCTAAGGYVDPPTEFLDQITDPPSGLAGEQPGYVAFRPALKLVEAAATKGPAGILAGATWELHLGDPAGGMALADLAVTGRGAWEAFQKSPPDENAVLAQIKLANWPPVSDPYTLLPEISQVLDRAYTVAWALRAGGQRPPGWLGVAAVGEP